MRKEFDVNRFRKLVALFDSDKQGEAENALHMAANMCAKHGLRLPEMLAQTFGETRVVYEMPSPRTWRERFATSRLRTLLVYLMAVAMLWGMGWLAFEVVWRGLVWIFGGVKLWTAIFAVAVGMYVGLADWSFNLCARIAGAIFQDGSAGE